MEEERERATTGRATTATSALNAPTSDRYNPRERYPVKRLNLGNVLNFGEENRVLASKFDADGLYVYFGCEDGTVKVVSTGKQSTRQFDADSTKFTLVPEQPSPVTCLALNTGSSTLKNSLLATYSDGGLGYWHATSKQLLSFKKFEKMLNCCGWSCNGQTYSFAGEDCKIHIGNLNKSNVFELKEGRLGEHSNRVYCTKWHPSDSNLLYSGGWDSVVYFWDIRCQEAVHKLYGFVLSGEGLDIRNDTMLIGNEDYEGQLKLYDMRTQKIQKLEWVDYGPQKSMVAACAFDQNGNVLAGSLKTNELRLFENNKCVDVFNDIPKHIYSVSASRHRNECVVTYGQGDAAFFTY